MTDVTAAPDDTIASVGTLMCDAGVRHVPVAVGGTVVGVVSIRDVLAVQLGAEGELINEHRRAEIASYAHGAAGTSAEVVARIDAINLARERLAANVPEQLAVEALMLALLPVKARTPRQRR